MNIATAARLSSRRPGRCCFCNSSIAVGDRILWEGYTRSAAHETCATAAPAPTNRLPFDPSTPTILIERRYRLTDGAWSPLPTVELANGPYHETTQIANARISHRIAQGFRMSKDVSIRGPELYKVSGTTPTGAKSEVIWLRNDPIPDAPTNEWLATQTWQIEDNPHYAIHLTNEYAFHSNSKYGRAEAEHLTRLEYARCLDPEICVNPSCGQITWRKATVGTYVCPSCGNVGNRPRNGPVTPPAPVTPTNPPNPPQTVAERSQNPLQTSAPLPAVNGFDVQPAPTPDTPSTTPTRKSVKIGRFTPPPPAEPPILDPDVSDFFLSSEDPFYDPSDPRSVASTLDLPQTAPRANGNIDEAAQAGDARQQLKQQRRGPRPRNHGPLSNSLLTSKHAPQTNARIDNYNAANDEHDFTTRSWQSRPDGQQTLAQAANIALSPDLSPAAAASYQSSQRTSSPLTQGTPPPKGRYTIVFRDGSYRTIKLREPSNDRPFKPDCHLLSYLSGPDNSNDYTPYGHITPDGRVFLWERYRNNLPLNDATLALMNDPIAAREAYALRSSKCSRCNRDLTVPASIHRGLGPECASKSSY